MTYWGGFCFCFSFSLFIFKFFFFRLLGGKPGGKPVVTELQTLRLAEPVQLSSTACLYYGKIHRTLTDGQARAGSFWIRQALGSLHSLSLLLHEPSLLVGFCSEQPLSSHTVCLASALFVLNSYGRPPSSSPLASLDSLHTQFPRFHLLFPVYHQGLRTASLSKP